MGMWTSTLTSPRGIFFTSSGVRPISRILKVALAKVDLASLVKTPKGREEVRTWLDFSFYGELRAFTYRP